LGVNEYIDEVDEQNLPRVNVSSNHVRRKKLCTTHR